MNIECDLFYYTAATVSFVQSTYLVDESDESVEIEMILSNQSSIDVVVQVTSSDIQAIGKHLSPNREKVGY